MPSCGDGLEFPLDERDLEGYTRIASWWGLERGEYVCVHAGARLPSRRWPLERFAQVADALAASGMRVVLTGTEEERVLTAAMVERAQMPRRLIDLAGTTTLGELAALIGHARLLVCNDTGVSHIAAALEVASVVICSGADPLRWGPSNRDRHRVLAHPIACRPCAYQMCPIGHPCATAITVDAVLRTIEDLSRDDRGKARPMAGISTAPVIHA